MLKKTIEYVDYEGQNRKEDFYFNLTKAEVLMLLTTSGDYTLDKYLAKLTRERNGKEIMKFFSDLIGSAYGEKSVDGRRFIKTEEVKRNFLETEAYSVLFMEVVTDAEKAAAFVNGIIPKELADEVNKAIEENPDGIPEELRDYIPKNTSK